MTKPLPDYGDRLTAWGGSKGKARNVRQPDPCFSCEHHPGDHKGLAGQAEAHCTIIGCACHGYRNWDWADAMTENERDDLIGHARSVVYAQEQGSESDLDYYLTELVEHFWSRMTRQDGT